MKRRQYYGIISWGKEKYLLSVKGTREEAEQYADEVKTTDPDCWQERIYIEKGINNIARITGTDKDYIRSLA